MSTSITKKRNATSQQETPTKRLKQETALPEEQLAVKQMKHQEPEPKEDQEPTFVRNVIKLLKRELIIRKQLIRPENFRCEGRRKHLLFELYEHGLEIKLMIKKLGEKLEENLKEEKLERSGLSN